MEIFTEEKRYFLWYQHKETNVPTQSTLDGVVVFFVFSFFTSAVITGLQMGEVYKLGPLIGWSRRDI
jgi:hypothetical protein